MDNFSSFLNGQSGKATRSDKDSDGEEITSILRNEQFDRCKYAAPYGDKYAKFAVVYFDLDMPFNTPTRYNSIDIMRDYA